MKKRILSLTLALSVLIGMLVLPSSAAGFTDVKKSDYFYDAVQWAVAQGITNGTSATTFSPNETCTRAQILTFMWRAAGSPIDTMFLINPYTDFDESEYYYQAALWAKPKGIVEGSIFAPNTPCTRASTVEYMWKAAGWKETQIVPFKDVTSGSQLEEAVSWAIHNGVTNGTSNTTFSPNDKVTRGQIVTFLYRQYVAPIDNSALLGGTKPTQPTQASDDKLDPLPPEDYRKQPDWYGTLTPAYTMSNARLIAELERIEQVIAERSAKGIYMSDGPYSRELDLWSQASQRYDIVKRYDRASGSMSDSTRKAYEELIATHGSADPLRDYFN